MTILEQVRSRKLKALVTAVVVGPSAILIPLAFGIQIKNPVIPLVVGFFTYYRMIRVDRHVMWFRKFHNTDRHRFRFNLLLNTTCSGLCIPITFQDSSFKASYLMSYTKLLLLFPVFMSTWLICFVMLAVPSVMFFDEPNAAAITWLIVAALLSAALNGLVIWKILEKRGFIRLTDDNANARVSKKLLKLKRRRLMTQGVMIFKCPDEKWREMVLLGITDASAVIIDVTDVSDNVAWEIRSTLEIHEPESILLACGRPEGSGDDLPEKVQAQLETALGADVLAKLKVFYYPEKMPRNQRAVFAALNKEFRLRLAHCMASAMSVAPPTVSG